MLCNFEFIYCDVHKVDYDCESDINIMI